MNRRPTLLRALSAVSVAAALVTTAALGTTSATAGTASVTGPSARADAPGVGFLSTFDFDAEGWTAYDPGGTAVWNNLGGNPGGFVSAQRGSGSLPGVSSPDAWAGDRSGLLGGALTVDLKLSPGAQANGVEFRLASNNDTGSYIYWEMDDVQTIASWTGFTLPIKPREGWVVDNPGSTPTGATRADFKDVLSSLTSIDVVAFIPGTTASLYVDNVKAASNVTRSLSLAYKANRFFGRITPAGGCASDTKVALWRVRPGPDTKVGSARTNGRGQWAIDDRKAPAGSYYAKVGGGFVEGGGTCSAARSSVVKVR